MLDVSIVHLCEHRTVQRGQRTAPGRIFTLGQDNLSVAREQLTSSNGNLRHHSGRLHKPSIHVPSGQNEWLNRFCNPTT
jgi:hypothetical protein